MRRQDDAIVHPLAFAPRGNNAGIAQVCEVARNFGLRRVENLYKVADADFAISHQVKQAEPRGVAERLEEPGKVKLSFCGHVDIFALTNTIVKNIVVLANML